MHLSKEEILKLSLTSQDLLEICAHVKYKRPISFGLKLRSKIFLMALYRFIYAYVDKSVRAWYEDWLMTFYTSN